MIVLFEAVKNFLHFSIDGEAILPDRFETQQADEDIIKDIALQAITRKTMYERITQLLGLLDTTIEKAKENEDEENTVEIMEATIKIIDSQIEFDRLNLDLTFKVTGLGL